MARICDECGREYVVDYNRSPLKRQKEGENLDIHVSATVILNPETEGARSLDICWPCKTKMILEHLQAEVPEEDA